MRGAQVVEVSSRDFAEDTASRCVTALQLFHLVGGWNKLLDQRANTSVFPGQLPVFDSIESRHPGRVPIHDPQQNRLVLLARFADRLSKVGLPWDLLPLRL